ncbi:hypothetical protein COLO4_07397 [Corchorus olitorius]|uniref:Uncharacterized protein n=1 Tax=Corchorus olitorius TaxID=93759 RepID=A0A1R3KJW4_9ROSI|nr:hypothetical protein COLO4_07397 [Corchorus olitorius]
MATAAIESNMMQNDAQPENEGIRSSPGEAVKSGNQINGSTFVMVQENPNPESEIQQKLYFRMHHGINNIRNEMKLLKEINGFSQKKGNDGDLGLSAVDEISNRIRKLQWSIRRNNYFPKERVDEMQVLKEINELKWAQDKAFANAPVKGKMWNSLPSKNAIKQQIKFMEEAARDEDRKEHLRLRAKIEVVKQAIVIREAILRRVG